MSYFGCFVEEEEEEEKGLLVPIFSINVISFVREKTKPRKTKGEIHGGWFGCKVEKKKEQTETNAVLLSLSPPFCFFFV